MLPSPLAVRASYNIGISDIVDIVTCRNKCLKQEIGPNRRPPCSPKSVPSFNSRLHNSHSVSIVQPPLMHFTLFLAASLTASSVLAVSNIHKRAAKYERGNLDLVPRSIPKVSKRQSTTYLTPSTQGETIRYKFQKPDS